MVKSKNDFALDIVVTLIVLVVGLVCFLPIMYVISASFTPVEEMMRNGGYVLIPKQWSVGAYREIFRTSSIMRALGVTARITVTGMLLSLTVTVLLAYPLSRQDFIGRKLLTQIAVFTMIFSAGTIPTYLMVKQTGLLDTIWAMILPGMISVYNLIVMKAYFEGLPSDVIESARIDGASEWRILTAIILPLALPIVATIGLYYAVSQWNTYMSAVLYITSPAKQPMQVILRRLIDSAAAADMNMDEVIPSETLQMAAVVIAVGPVVVVYPFIQKYFVKGTLAGAVKG